MLIRDYKVDLHIHTNASDGTWTTEELLELIIQNNIKLFSITDHDTIENSIRMLGKVPEGIRYIIGCEISCTYNGQEYHVTAYDFDPENSRLKEVIDFNLKERQDFDTKVVRFVGKTNKRADVSDYFLYEDDRRRGGWESLNYLIDKNIVKNLKEYLDLAALSKEILSFKSPKEVIETIKSAGGHPFLAHPSAYAKGDKLSLEILKEWRDFGISGIECFSPYLKHIEDADYYIKFCNENNLMISAGSDCHGGFNNRTLGVPNVNLEQLRLDFINAI